MTLLERDILAVVLSLNTVFMILILPGIVPINYDFGTPSLYLTTLLWGGAIGALGVWLNHRAERPSSRGGSTPPRR